MTTYKNLLNRSNTTERLQVFEMLMRMEEEIGLHHNDWSDRCLRDMHEVELEMRQYDSPFDVINAVTGNFSTDDDYALLISSGRFVSFSKENAIDYMIKRRRKIEKEFLSLMNPEVAKHWDAVLETDRNLTQHDSWYEGATLGQLLIENIESLYGGLTDSIFDIDMKIVNHELSNFNIKEIE